MDHEFSREDIINAIEDNQFSFFRACSDWPQIKVYESDEIWQVESDIPFPPLNGIWRAKLLPGKVEEIIQSIVMQAKLRNVPVLWRVAPISKPVDLGGYLIKHGFVELATIPGMAIDLTKLDDDFQIPENLKIYKAIDRESLKTWAEIFVSGGDFPEFMYKHIFERNLYANSDQLLTYVGWLDGKPVATSQMVLVDGVAGIYNVGTIPAARRRGIGSLMTRVPLLHAKSRDYKLGVLSASEMGFNIYQSIGFEEVCKIKLYLFSPHGI